MALKTRISKADFDALADSLKTEYIPEGDGYKLDADYEDVTGLKAKRDELLAETKRLKELTKGFEGLDPSDVRAKLDALAEKENEKLAAEGKWKELEANLRKQQADKEANYEQRIAKMIADNAEKDLRLTLTSLGTLEEEAENLSILLRAKHIKPVQDGEAGVIWKSLDDTQIIDLKTFIPEQARAAYPKHFKSDINPGSGASGSGKGGGQQVAKQMTKAQVAGLDAAAKREFYLNGGEVIDAR